eukprot:gnl/TRDRNA2_/TRDRNA2_192722_c0_seq1.p1 gnl/TRDRNA2_/TRDRNA2_192722_c0~~gnl/TRDRNA2_/TRDRNA2_192722_c0_seq1.p1  ORF type:complete len:120 (+),score=27.72 gnl/TRDRNA2_/TRDRNA2_192722_c0_seq1:82-441(+)
MVRKDGPRRDDRHTDSAKHRAKAAEAAASSIAALQARALPSNAYRYEEGRPSAAVEEEPPVDDSTDLSAARGVSAAPPPGLDSDRGAAATGIDVWAVEAVLRKLPLEVVLGLETEDVRL